MHLRESYMDRTVWIAASALATWLLVGAAAMA